jgi:hypothetical protein
MRWYASGRTVKSCSGTSWAASTRLLATTANALARGVTGAALAAVPTRDGNMTRPLVWLRQLPCALRGHDEVMHFERNRLSLRCLSCGHQTAGWCFGPDVIGLEGPTGRPNQCTTPDALGMPLARPEAWSNNT